MATKTMRGKDPKKALLITAMKKTINKNTTLPILENVLIMPDCVIGSDLETFVKIPYRFDGAPEKGVCVPFGMLEKILGLQDAPTIKVNTSTLACTFAEGKKIMKVSGDNSDNYPRWPDGEFVKAGELNESGLKNLETALKFVSNDELRPALTGVLMGEQIAATDAHRLYWDDLGFEKEFILPQRTANLLLALGGNWTVSVSETRCHFVRPDGVEVSGRSIDAKFPDYKLVIPAEENNRATLTINPDELLKELAAAAVFCNKYTNMVKFHLNGGTKISSCDVDLGTEYENELELAKLVFNKNHKFYKIIGDAPDEYQGETVGVLNTKKWLGRDLLPNEVVVEGGWGGVIEKDRLKECDDHFDIGFNYKFLEEIVKINKDQPVEMVLHGPTKATVINKNFLVMPLLTKTK